MIELDIVFLAGNLLYKLVPHQEINHMIITPFYSYIQEKQDI